MSVIASAKVPIYEVQSTLTKLERFQLRLPVCFALDMDCQHGSASLSLASDFLEYAVLHGFKTAFSCGNERKWKPRTIRLSTLEIESRIHIRPGGVEYTPSADGFSPGRRPKQALMSEARPSHLCA